VDFLYFHRRVFNSPKIFTALLTTLMAASHLKSIHFLLSFRRSTYNFFQSCDSDFEIFCLFTVTKRPDLVTKFFDN
jgi:hypothetical protein